MEGRLILNRYRPLAEIGSGGFATVILAWDTRMQRRVAIKRLPFPLDASGSLAQPPGLAEARTAAMLSHPAIVTTYDFDTDADEAFIVMEYVDGMPLSAVLDAAEGPLTLDETAAVAGAVAAALVHAHENGVLHLDIKPENVLVSRDGAVKVTDFGIAALSARFGHGPALGGTPGYMPLEQIDGREVSERTDEWAFAALVFEMLAGMNPFAGASEGDSAARIALFDPPALSSIVPDVPAELDAVLARALADRPRDRYPDVAAFADELLAALGDPEAGRASLAELVGACLDEEDKGLAFPDERIGLWDRFGGRLGGLAVRCVALAESAWLASAGISQLALGDIPRAGAVLIVALAAVLAPSLGIALGLGCLIVGLAAIGAVAPALVLAVGCSLWWLRLGRTSAGAAVLPLAAPVLGLARLGFMQPLLAGFALAPRPAAATALVGGALLMLASAASLSVPPYLDISTSFALHPWESGTSIASIGALATSPAAWVALAGWPLAAALMSIASARATRAGAAAGAIGGVAVLAGAHLAADQLATHVSGPSAPHWVNGALAASLACSLILMIGVAWLGPPPRSEPAGTLSQPLGSREDGEDP